MSSNKPGQVTCRAFLQQQYTSQVFLSLVIDYVGLARRVQIFPQETTVFTGSVPNSYFEDIDQEGYKIKCDVKTSTQYYEDMNFVVTGQNSKKVFSSKEFMYAFLQMAIAQGDTVFSYGDILHCYVTLPTGSIIYFDILLVISAIVDVGVPSDVLVQTRIRNEFAKKHYDLINHIYETSDIKGFAHSNGIPMDDVMETVRTGDIMPYSEIIDTLSRDPYDEFLNPSRPRAKDLTSALTHKDFLLLTQGSTSAGGRVKYRKRYNQPGTAAYVREALGNMYRFFWGDRLKQPYGNALVKTSTGLQQYMIDNVKLPFQTADAMVEAIARYGLVAVDKYMGYDNSDILRSSDIATDIANLYTASSILAVTAMPGSIPLKLLAATIQAAYVKAYLQIDRNVVDSSIRGAIRFFQNNKDGYGNPGDYPYVDMAIDAILGDSIPARAFMGATTSIGTILTMKTLFKSMSWLQAASFGFAKFNNEYQIARELMYGGEGEGMLRYMDRRMESFYKIRPDLNHLKDKVRIMALEGQQRALELGYQGIQEAKDAGVYIVDQLAEGKNQALKLYQNAEKQMYQLSQSAQYMMSRDPVKFLQGYMLLASNIDRIQTSIENVFQRKAGFRAVEYSEELLKLYDKTKEVSKFFDKAKYAAKSILRRQEAIEQNPNPYTEENRLLKAGIERNENDLLLLANDLIQGHAELMVGMEEFRQFRDDNFYENDFADADRFYEHLYGDGIPYDVSDYLAVGNANDLFNRRAKEAVPALAAAAAMGIGEVVQPNRRRRNWGVNMYKQALLGALGAGLGAYLIGETSSGKQALTPYAHTNNTFSYQSPNITNVSYPSNDTSIPQIRKRDIKQIIKDTYYENKNVVDTTGAVAAAIGTGYLAYNIIANDAEGGTQSKDFVKSVEDIVESTRPAVNTLNWERASRIKRGEHDFKTYSRRFYRILREQEEEEMKRRKRKNRFAIYY